MPSNLASDVSLQSLQFYAWIHLAPEKLVHLNPAFRLNILKVKSSTIEGDWFSPSLGLPLYLLESSQHSWFFSFEWSFRKRWSRQIELPTFWNIDTLCSNLRMASSGQNLEVYVKAATGDATKLGDCNSLHLDNHDLDFNIKLPHSQVHMCRNLSLWVLHNTSWPTMCRSVFTESVDDVWAERPSVWCEICRPWQEARLVCSHLSSLFWSKSMFLPEFCCIHSLVEMKLSN